MNECPLCLSKAPKEPLKTADGRTCYLCGECSLIFADSSLHASEADEKKRYQFHINGKENKGYVDFLNNAIEPAMKFITPEMSGLDYGCGPGPVLSELLKTKQIKCANYDPFFFPNIDTSQKYDFVFATECFEHFFYPGRELEKISGLIKKGGYLIVMTQRWTDAAKFGTWNYTKDFTHVSFYHGETFAWIDRKYCMVTVYDNKKDVSIFNI